jgi:predicted enzyme related to lactoylglutathione lyase
MSETKSKVGHVAWHDLTVPNAGEVRDFYEAVVGWTAQGIDMGGYEDFSMVAPEDGEGAAGICHARGANANIPAQWIMYITVADLDASMAQVAAKGGKIIDGPRSMGDSRYCFIQDPAGAVCGLWQS